LSPRLKATPGPPDVLKNAGSVAPPAEAVVGDGRLDDGGLE
jgi:hypothetical protein